MPQDPNAHETGKNGIDPTDEVVEPYEDPLADSFPANEMVREEMQSRHGRIVTVDASGIPAARDQYSDH